MASVSRAGGDHCAAVVRGGDGATATGGLEAASADGSAGQSSMEDALPPDCIARAPRQPAAACVAYSATTESLRAVAASSAAKQASLDAGQLGVDAYQLAFAPRVRPGSS